MSVTGSDFAIYPAYENTSQLYFTYSFVANDLIGAYAVLSENSTDGTEQNLVILQATSSNTLNQIKQYPINGNSLGGIKAAWVVDSQHFAVILNNGADNIMLFDKNGNVVKGL